MRTTAPRPTSKSQQSRMPPVWLQLGFRPFFMLAATFSAVSMGVWLSSLNFGIPSLFLGLPGSWWHAHEMLYGYAMAVVAGFLLTAVPNWTGRPPSTGSPLLGMALLWSIARLSFLITDLSLWVPLVADGLFVVVLSWSVMRPILQVQQWRQSGIMAKLLLLGVGNLLFYLGALGVLAEGVRWGIYGGLYLMVGLVLTMARRVVPPFTQSGVGYPKGEPLHSVWLDRTALALFLGFFVLEVFAPETNGAGWVSLTLFGVHAWRWKGWYTHRIWKAPLVWSLHLAYVFLIAGFLLVSLAQFQGVPPMLATHAFALGGIGLITLGMMARVSWGHSGRNVRQPPKGLGWMFGMLLIAVFSRVVLPLLDFSHYFTWILVAQVSWIAAFLGFLKLYLPVLTQPRVDGKRGEEG